MSRKFKPGYFMLEVVLALGVAAMVMYGVFALANGAMALSGAIAEEGRDQIARESFFNFMGRNFEKMPGNTVLDLKSTEGRNQWLTEMTFQNTPTLFSWAGQSLAAEAVQLATIESGGDRVNVVLRYYDEAILDDADSTADFRAEPIAELVLLRDLYTFEWEVLDGRTMEWQYDWEVAGRMPTQLKLEARFTPEDDLIVHHFWIPPKMSPELVMKNLQRLNTESGTATGSENTNQNGRGNNGNNQTERTGGRGNVPQVRGIR